MLNNFLMEILDRTFDYYNNMYKSFHMKTFKPRLFLIVINFFLINILCEAQSPYAQSALIVNEINYNPQTEEAFIELLVPDNGEHIGEYVDLSGWIIDNYSDVSDDDNAMIRLGEDFSAVKPGTLIVLYDSENTHSAILSLSDFESYTLQDLILFVPLNSDKIEIINHSDFERGRYSPSYQTTWKSIFNLKSSNNGIFVWNPDQQLLNGVAWMNNAVPYAELRGVTNVGNTLSNGPFSLEAGTLCPTDIRVRRGSGLAATPGSGNNPANSNSVGNNPQPLYFSIYCSTYITTGSTNLSQGKIEFIGGLPPFEITVRNSSGAVVLDEETTEPVVYVDGEPGETYNVLVIDSRGCKESCSYRLPHDINVETICEGERVQIGLDIDADCFKWEPETGLIFPSSTYPEAAPTETTTYTLMISDGCGAITSIHEYKVEVQEVEELEIISDPDPPVMDNQDIVLSASGDWESYLWFIPFFANIPQDQPTLTITPEIFEVGVQSNSATIYLRTTDATGCQNMAEIEIFKDPCDGQDQDGDGICDNEDFDPYDPCIPYHQDTDGDGICDGDDCHKYDPLIGEGLPCDDGDVCTMNDTYDENCNCTGQSISVGQICDDGDDCTIDDQYNEDCQCQGTASLDFEIVDNSQEPCENGLVTLSVDQQFDHYRWFNEQEQIVGELQTISLNATGLYYVEVYNTNNCSERKSIFIDDYSIGQLEILADGNDLCGNGDVMNLSIDERYENVIWEDEDGNILDTENNITISEAGTYKVTASGSMGCVLTGEKKIASSMGDFSFEPEYPVLCDGAELELSVLVENQISNDLQARWSDDVEGLSRFVNEVGSYTVMLSDENDCILTHVFEVESEEDINIGSILTAEGFESIDIEILNISAFTSINNFRSSSNTCDFSVANADVYELRFPQTGETFILNESLLDYEENSETCGTTIGVALMDDVCNPDFPDSQLSCFLSFSENYDHSFQLYVDREAEKMYFRNTGINPGIGLNNVENRFKDEMYKMLCAKLNNETYTLSSDNQKIGANFLMTAFTNYLTYESGTGIELMLNPYFVSNDVVVHVRNYEKNGTLKLFGANSIQFSTRSQVRYKKYGVWPTKKTGNFNVIKIPYVDSQGETCDYLEIVILNADDFEDIRSLFENTEEQISNFLNGPFYNTASLAILPTCLFQEELCTILKDKIPLLSWPNRRNAVYNTLKTATNAQSKTVVDCFRDNYLVKPYVEEYANGREIFLLDQLVRRNYDAYPPDGNAVIGEPDFMLSGSRALGIGDLFSNEYHQNSVTTTHQERQFVMGQPITYVRTLAEKEFNYFDYYSVYLEYNKDEPDEDFFFLDGSPIKTIDGKEVHANTMVPGLYLPLASLKYEANERAEDIGTVINVVSLLVGFGELNLAIQGGRAALLRGILAAGEITVSTASLLLEESAFCESFNNPQIEDFCDEHKKWLPYANAILLAGGVTDQFITSFKNARTKYEALPEEHRQLLDNYLQNEGYGQNVLRNLYKATDLRLILQNVFSEVHQANPSFFHNLIAQMQSNGSANNAAKLLEFASDIKQLELGRRLEFFNDISNTIFHIDGIGYNLLKFQSGWITGWEKLFDFPNLRNSKDILESFVKVKRIGNYVGNVKPTRINTLTRTHGVPKLGQEGDIAIHQNTFSGTGYDLSQPIPVVALPDGTKLMADGHHRLKAMENLDQIVVPVDELSVLEAKLAYGEHDFATLVEVSKLSGNYTGSYTGASGLALEQAQDAAINFMNTYFPGWN